ncbi:MAG: hypothetical protein DRP93_05520, partial [Candidatus Neomarinimicrobiota bacterium]
MKIFRHIVLFLFIVASAFGATWCVPDSINTIQTAIDTAQSGDTILVSNPYQNIGSVEIIGKKIALLSKSYINNPANYVIATGTALYDTVNTLPLLKISNADGSMIKGFLLDKSDIGNGGGVLVENSNNVVFCGVNFNSNCFILNNAEVCDTNTTHYAFSSDDSASIILVNSTLTIENSTWKEMSSLSLLSMDQNSELSARNLAVYKNICTSSAYHINASTANFNFMTSYGNTFTFPVWDLHSSYALISNSILEFAPPIDTSQYDVRYSAIPDNYPGFGNISLDPKINTVTTYPALWETSPCISAADPDTSGIPRTDILGNARPNPIWAPPDMGAFESSRHMFLNDAHHFWVSMGGHDTWGNGTADHPFATLQAAVDYSGNFDTLLLQPGQYRDCVEINNKSLTISSSYLLNRDSSYVDSVVLFPDSGITAPIILAKDVDSLNISGISFKEGRGRSFYNNYTLGGAFYCENSFCDLENIVFEGNRAYYSGGALYALGSTLNLDHIDFNNNYAYLGGAISLSSSVATIAHVNIENNFASSGGGIYAENNTKLIGFYTRISKNIAIMDSIDSHLQKPLTISQYGGGIYAINSDIRLHNTIIDHNLAYNKGAGIALRSSKIYFVQSTLTDNNTSADSSAVLYINDTSDPSLILNSILWNPGEYEIELSNSDIEISHSILDGAQTEMLDREGNNDIELTNVLDSNPLFGINYSLSGGSPAIDQGVASYTRNDKYLINYTPAEYAGSAPDLGYWGAFPNVYFTLESIESSLTNYPESYSLLHAFPNPFNPRTTLEFTLDVPGNTEICIFNIRGQFIQKILKRELTSG